MHNLYIFPNKEMDFVKAKTKEEAPSSYRILINNNSK